MTEGAVQILANNIPIGSTVDVSIIAESRGATTGRVYSWYVNEMMLGLEIDFHGGTRYKFIDLNHVTKLDLI